MRGQPRRLHSVWHSDGKPARLHDEEIEHEVTRKKKKKRHRKLPTEDDADGAHVNDVADEAAKIIEIAESIAESLAESRGGSIHWTALIHQARESAQLLGPASIYG